MNILNFKNKIYGTNLEYAKLKVESIEQQEMLKMNLNNINKNDINSNLNNINKGIKF